MVKYVINPDGLIIDVQSGEVVENLVFYEILDLQLDYYNNNSH